MKKILLASFAVASLIALDGCASSSTVKVTEINTISKTQSTNIHSFGAANAQILGPVFSKSDDRCAVNDVIRAATKMYPNVSNVMNIRMEETSVASGNNTTYSCKSSAIAINYKSVSPEEYAEWKISFASNDIANETASFVEKTPADQETAAPIAEPVAEESENQPSKDEFFVR